MSEEVITICVQDFLFLYIPTNKHNNVSIPLKYLILRTEDTISKNIITKNKYILNLSLT